MRRGGGYLLGKGRVPRPSTFNLETPVMKQTFFRPTWGNLCGVAFAVALMSSPGYCLAAVPPKAGPMRVQPAATMEQAVQDGGKIFAQDSFGSKQTWVPNGAFGSHVMSCAACHANGGTTEGVTPSGARLPSLVGAASNYPKFKAKKHAVYTLERQIVHCVRAGIMGQPPGYNSPEMVDLVVYLTALSKGATMGHQMPAVAH